MKTGQAYRIGDDLAAAVAAKYAFMPKSSIGAPIRAAWWSLRRSLHASDTVSSAYLGCEYAYNEHHFRREVVDGVSVNEADYQFWLSKEKMFVDSFVAKIKRAYIYLYQKGFPCSLESLQRRLADDGVTVIQSLLTTWFENHDRILEQLNAMQLQPSSPNSVGDPPSKPGFIRVLKTPDHIASDQQSIDPAVLEQRLVEMTRRRNETRDSNESDHRIDARRRSTPAERDERQAETNKPRIQGDVQNEQLLAVALRHSLEREGRNNRTRLESERLVNQDNQASRENDLALVELIMKSSNGEFTMLDCISFQSHPFPD